ncbi:MAG: sigma-70 family RNA polymerase sigma factor [Kiritimatiellia bacterium]
MEIPKTSTTLLRNLACDSQHARWAEFVARYRPMMESYMHGHFPSLEPDEMIQETLIALIKVFPVYHYSPNENGSFHNYLTGILRHKAIKALRAKGRREEFAETYIAQVEEPVTLEEQNEGEWQKSIFEIALQQLLMDDTVYERTKQIFTRIAVNGEKPESVAAAFGLERNAVDQIKSRMMVRLRELVAALENAEKHAKRS